LSLHQVSADTWLDTIGGAKRYRNPIPTFASLACFARVFFSQDRQDTSTTPSAAIRDLDVVPFRGAGVELARTADLHRRIGNHLLPMRDPADRSRDGEHHRKHRLRNSDRAVDDPRVEIDVRVQFALHEIFVFERNLLEL